MATALTDNSLEARIQRVEHGLPKMYATGPSKLGKTYALAERMQDYQVPVVSIAVINNYEIEWARGYGVLEAGSDQPVSVDKLFHAGSVAKTLSAAAVLTLVERGLLDLDEDVNDRLVTWQVPENEYTTQQKVTLRRLLSHSAGLQDGFTNRSSGDPEPTYIAPAGQAPTVTLPQLLDAAPGVDVDGRTLVTMIPGTEYRYSNADYAIVELLLADVLQQPFPQFMAETVLDPLEMSSSTFEQPLPEELRTRATSEHDLNGKPLEGKRHHFPLLAAGGLWTTPSDLARFALEIMLAYNGESEKVLSQAAAIEMLSSQIPIKDNPFYDANGLGFHLSTEDPDLIFLHTGATWGSSCVLFAYPERGQGAVIMTNKASEQVEIRLEILLSIAAEYGWPLGQ
jgi:CubicO group peptidase (beta-lactamase class C family)